MTHFFMYLIFRVKLGYTMTWKLIVRVIVVVIVVVTGGKQSQPSLALALDCIGLDFDKKFPTRGVSDFNDHFPSLKKI